MIRFTWKFTHNKKRWFFPIMGLAAILWFMIRVIPKPSRAAYPCQRVAAPIGSTFIVWLFGVISSVALFRRIRHSRFMTRPVWSSVLVIFFLITLTMTLVFNPTLPSFAVDAPFTPTDPPNAPMGTAQGIHPGRVVWFHNPDATSWNGSGYWWQESYTNQSVVSKMFSESIKSLTETSTNQNAWNALFNHFNKTHGLPENGYIAGKKIAVKVNMNQVGNHRSNTNEHYAAPQTVYALLQHLVQIVGVPQNNITIYDVTRYIASSIYDKCHATFPDVRFVDWAGGEGRIKYVRDTNTQVKWSQNLTLEPGGGNPTYLPKSVSEATYLINLGSLRGHDLTGVTICAKNNFGSLISYESDGTATSSAPMNAGLHPYICVHDDFHSGGHWDFDKRAMATYNCLVDIMGHQHLGAKTLLFIIDGLYATPTQNNQLENDDKWVSFNNDWPSSLFMSQDGVAMESVCLDFLRNEPTITNVKGNVDNYLHEAAKANAPPSGIVYDPEKDGSGLQSLGVHEHWNNNTEKAYSRNLGTGSGIELIQLNKQTIVIDEQLQHGIVPDKMLLLSNYPNPFNAGTKIEYTLPNSSNVKIEIYSMLGQKIRTLKNSHSSAGSNTMLWDSRDAAGKIVPTGIYFVQLTTENQRITHKMTLVQ